MNPEMVRTHCAETLMDLCEEMPIGDVTVTLLVKRAGISRQTFYNYFLDMNDLITFAGSRPLITGRGPLFAPENTRRTLDYTLRHRGFFTQLPSCTAGQNNFRDSYLAWVRDNCYALFVTRDLPAQERLSRKLAIDMYTAGFFALIMEWFAGGMETPVDAVVQTIRDAKPPFIAEAVPQTPSKFPDMPR